MGTVEGRPWRSRRNHGTETLRNIREQPAALLRSPSAGNGGKGQLDVTNVRLAYLSNGANEAGADPNRLGCRPRIERGQRCRATALAGLPPCHRRYPSGCRELCARQFGTWPVWRKIQPL